MKVFVTGGARSGKSDFAERYAMRSAASGIYIATSQSWDDEMATRIKQHKELREASGFPWRTIEEPLELAAALRQLDQEGATASERPVVLVDCLTLWLTNWLLRLEPMAEEGDHSAVPSTLNLKDVIDDLVDAVASCSSPLLLVSNEVGSGIVPAYPLGRRFRDEAGRLNRQLAAVCTEAYLVVAGFPLDLKAHAFRLEDV
ncbi:Bifunctional adenosylcobalamin biosynthesis protein CobP [Paenibacillus plantiphilus]|uniref:Adenosylcobinamide kinase n=1 Tax=Paenibacillus plantiphilus TaxID=2905650 RepID=A0ABM9BYA1_9BACL|nr:bifunctional adenosylcobinamide kinase/adenosylcobinamide-phosphate guanylyltransferase [Paenibacillus plantiphilus]CAH1197708.1 Bifunctional adenosylcobalamin biosynthesis protein CobP [Paenibacillus plantiphilus]